MQQPTKRKPRPRLIPVLLMHKDGLLYKTRRFKEAKYVGDPRIAVKIFNDKGADEIVLLDITATREGRAPNFGLIEEIASEAFMPVAYGGAVKTLEQAKTIFSLGIEKIVLNAAAAENPDLVTSISNHGGAQSVLVSIDAKKDMFGRWRTYINGGKKSTGLRPDEFARKMESLGAGEIMINAIDHDGTFEGYDDELMRMVSDAVSLPVIGCGGASNIQECARMVHETGASAAAAGSMFVFQGPHRAVLIKFPNENELKTVFA